MHVLILIVELDGVLTIKDWDGKRLHFQSAFVEAATGFFFRYNSENSAVLSVIVRIQSLLKRTPPSPPLVPPALPPYSSLPPTPSLPH